MMTANFHHPCWKVSSALAGVNYVEWSLTNFTVADPERADKWKQLGIDNPKECSQHQFCFTDHRDANVFLKVEEIVELIDSVRTRVLWRSEWLQTTCMRLEEQDPESAINWFPNYNYLYCKP